MISRLGMFAREEFESIVEERRVIDRVNALEEVIRDAKRRKADGLGNGEEGEVVA